MKLPNKLSSMIFSTPFHKPSSWICWKRSLKTAPTEYFPRSWEKYPNTSIQLKGEPQTAFKDLKGSWKLSSRLIKIPNHKKSYKPKLSPSQKAKMTKKNNGSSYPKTPKRHQLKNKPSSSHKKSPKHNKNPPKYHNQKSILNKINKPKSLLLKSHRQWQRKCDRLKRWRKQKRWVRNKKWFRRRNWQQLRNSQLQKRHNKALQLMRKIGRMWIRLMRRKKNKLIWRENLIRRHSMQMSLMKTWSTKSLRRKTKRTRTLTFI